MQKLLFEIKKVKIMLITF